MTLLAEHSSRFASFAQIRFSYREFISFFSFFKYLFACVWPLCTRIILREGINVSVLIALVFLLSSASCMYALRVLRVNIICISLAGSRLSSFARVSSRSISLALPLSLSHSLSPSTVSSNGEETCRTLKHFHLSPSPSAIFPFKRTLMFSLAFFFILRSCLSRLASLSDSVIDKLILKELLTRLRDRG